MDDQFWDDHHVTTTGFNFKNLLTEFVDSPTNDIRSRFPKNYLLAKDL